ncbi:cryptochrome/photolyase family protein [Nocardioides euryhalodurans]|uniref:Cryptochrome/photolyase family protein n=1 Tax=Nocardioides euryhalodurans TaxID=2518370 RepID=A0A4P7GKN9_9ACTN|nr:cryptochrome/photolyase family protein [Nocardioides euryhalodurans]QBR92241.1 cryptochrome/photolyase family protein [Nocardioides euryhalodurans]
MTRLRWLLGDQLGPHFVHDHRGPVLLVESRAVFVRRRFHRAKAHLVLSAMRHRAAELGDRTTYVNSETYAPAVREHAGSGPVQVVHPTSYAALGLVRRLAEELDLTVLDARGFATSRDDFTAWADGRGGRRLLMEDFYRDARRRHGVLLDGGGPAGGRWNFDEDNREPPPRGADTLGVPEPWWPEEDDIDAEVREDLDRWERNGDVTFLGRDGPRRFPATRREALAALDRFVEHRLPHFGAHEDAVLEGDPWMAHSLVSAPLNLGLLEPLEVVRRAEEAYLSGDAPIAAVEGFVRQVLGWRDYVWHLYWHLGPSYRRRNELSATERVPQWFRELDAAATDARCLSHTLDQVATHGWVHHIPRLMVLGSYAMQRGWSPSQVTDWFHRAFVDGYDWVMVPNVVGMSQHADGGVMATKPYTSGGAYLNRMTDHCGSCRFDPTVRVGEDACPFTAGYWWFLDRHRERFAGNQRMAQAVRGLDRLSDLDGLVAQEESRGNRPP